MADTTTDVNKLVEATEHLQNATLISASFDSNSAQVRGTEEWWRCVLFLATVGYQQVRAYDGAELSVYEHAQWGRLFDDLSTVTFRAGDGDDD